MVLAEIAVRQIPWGDSSRRSFLPGVPCAAPLGGTEGGGVLGAAGDIREAVESAVWFFVSRGHNKTSYVTCR